MNLRVIVRRIPCLAWCGLSLLFSTPPGARADTGVSENGVHTMCMGSFGVAWIDNTSAIWISAGGTAAPQRFWNTSPVRRIIAADLDGDNQHELVWRTAGLQLYIHNFGTGATLGPVIPPSGVTYDMSAGVINPGDNFSTLHLASRALYKYDYQTGAFTLLSTVANEHVCIRRGNFDPTNAVDEFMTVNTNRSAKVWYPATGTFSVHQGNCDFYVMPLNLDGSGREELACIGSGQNAIYTFANFGSGSSAVYTGGSAALIGNPEGNRCLAAGDLDGNGRDELYAIGGSYSLYQYVQGRNPAWTGAFPSPNVGWSRVILGNIDADPQDEIFLVNDAAPTTLLRYDAGTPSVVVVLPAPQVASMLAWPPTVPVGGTVELEWDTTNATELRLTGGGVTNLLVTGQTTFTTGPLPATTNFRLTASNVNGSVFRDVVVGVGVTPLPPRLNEVLASNLGILAPPTGGDPDWVELRNPNPHGFLLSGLHLTDTGDERKWAFPARVQVPGNGFFQIWCSGLTGSVSRTSLHAPFRLSAGGFTLRLVDAAGAVALDSLAVPAGLENVSYGHPAGGGAPAHLALVTAGAENSPADGPVLTALTENPLPAPGDADDVRVTVAAAPNAAPVAAVTLVHRRQWDAEATVAMTDDGAGADLAAGDGVFSAWIPAGAAGPGEMLRWRVTATDAAGATATAPTHRLPSASPRYHGVVIADPAVASPLSVLHLMVENPSAMDTLAGTAAAFAGHGDFLDNVFVRARGNTSLSYAKKSHKVRFNEGHGFRLDPAAPRVDEINLNTTHTDKSSLRSVLASALARDAGLPNPQCAPVHLRRNGAFHSLALLTEQIDPRLLARWGLDADGALYKSSIISRLDETASLEKKTRTTEGKADAQALVNALLANSSAGAGLDAFLFDQVDVPMMVNFLATIALSQNIDCAEKNYFLHRSTTGDGTWRLLGYDQDLTFGPDGLNTDAIVHDPALPGSGNRPNASHPYIGGLDQPLIGGKYNLLIDRMWKSPRTRGMALRRMRTLVDSRLASGFLDQVLEQWVPLIQADELADRAAWGASAHFAGTDYSLTQSVARIRNEYLAPRLAWFNRPTTAWSLGAGAPESLPASAPFAADMVFGAVEAAPASGNQDHEYIELVNFNGFSVDLSGWTLSGGVTLTLPAGTVVAPGESLYLSPNTRAFRQRPSSPTGGEGRFVVGPYSGHLSNGGETLTLRDAAGAAVSSVTLPEALTDAQRYLVVSEIMYNPGPAAPLAEYIELMNISTNLTLDLAGVAFTNGVSFAFTGPAATNLAPGARVLLVRDAAAFAAAHGAGHPVAGVFTNGTALANGGERLKLDDALGNTIADFAYGTAFPWPEAAAGQGRSLVLVRPHTRPDPALPENWRASAAPGGSPGGSDTETFAGDPSADLDGNGERDLLDHAFGNNPARGRFTLQPGWVTNGVPARIHFTATYRRNLAADDVRLEAQFSPLVLPWVTEAPGLARIAETVDADGTSRVTLMAVRPLEESERGAVRVRATWSP